MKLHSMPILIAFMLIFVSDLTKPIYSQINIKTMYFIEDEIITNIDIKNEFRYLVAVNAKFSDLNDNEALKIATKSLIEQTIKKIELKKYFNFGQNYEFLDKIILSNYKKIGLNNKNEISDYFKEFDLDYEFIQKKSEIEQLWKEFIIQKFESKVNIDEKALVRKIKSSQKEIISYNLYEILFQLKENENLDEKYKSIKNDVMKNGFEISANKYSVSSTAQDGGKLGWVDDFQLSKSINKELSKIEIEEISKPIRVSSGFLILKYSETKKKDKSLNVNKELIKLKEFERNKQLSSLANIYYNKLLINLNVEKN